MIFSDDPFLAGLGILILINIFLYNLLVQDDSGDCDKQGSTLAPPAEEGVECSGDSGGGSDFSGGGGG